MRPNASQRRALILVGCVLVGLLAVSLAGLVGYHETIRLCPKPSCRIVAPVHGWPLVVDRGTPVVTGTAADSGLREHLAVHEAVNRLVGVGAGLLAAGLWLTAGGLRRRGLRRQQDARA